jgi:hypothetical protein
MRARFVVGLVLAVLALVTYNGTATASTYAHDCPAIADDLTTTSTTTSQCLAIADRLEAVQATDAGASGISHGDVMFLIGAVLGAGFLPPLVHLLFGR